MANVHSVGDCIYNHCHKMYIFLCFLDVKLKQHKGISHIESLAEAHQSESWMVIAMSIQCHKFYFGV